jgi:hypothetical protein
VTVEIITYTVPSDGYGQKKNPIITRTIMPTAKTADGDNHDQVFRKIFGGP